MSEASPSVSPSVSLPTIDLARDAAQQLPAVDRSLRDAGFLLVTGHGVDPDRPSPDVIRPVLRGDAAVADYLGGSGYYGSAPARVTQAVRLSRARAWALTSGPLAALGKVDMDEELARLLKGAGRPAGWRRPPSTGPSPAVSNAEWALIEPLLPAPACEPAAGGRPEAFAHLSADPPGKVVRGSPCRRSTRPEGQHGEDGEVGGFARRLRCDRPDPRSTVPDRELPACLLLDDIPGP